MSSIFYYISVSLIALAVGLLVRCLMAFLSDSSQRRSALQTVEAKKNEQSIGLAAKLRRTYIDLSMQKRQTTWQNVMVVKIVQESTDVRSFYLVDTAHEPLPTAQPGQHLLLERPATMDNEAMFRCYSLSDDRSEGHWRISVKKSSNHPSSVSRWLHDQVGVGDILRVKGPSGAFYFRSESERNVVFASAGIGITPMIPMLIEAIRRPCASISLFAQFRDVEHLPFAEWLLSVSSQYPNIDMNLWISRFPKGVRRHDNGYFFEGKFQASQLLNRPEATSNTDYYLCGPEEWQSRLCNELVASGVSQDRIEYELFQQSEKPTNVQEHSIEHHVLFSQSGAKIMFDRTHTNLLGCASKNHVSMESGCRVGACGSCAVRLLKGKVRYTREPQFPVRSNEILPCVCVPETDLVVEA